LLKQKLCLINLRHLPGSVSLSALLIAGRHRNFCDDDRIVEASNQGN